MTRPRKLALVGVAIATAWYLTDAIRPVGIAGGTAVILYLAIGIWVVERLERRP